MYSKLRLLLATLASVGIVAMAHAQAPSPNQREDTEQAKILQDGANLLRARKAQEAITAYFDRVIAHYESKYREEDRQIYCTRNTAEMLGVLAKHAVETPQKGAIAISSLWCDAHYLKAYAHIELAQIAEAKNSLEQAVSRAPFNSQYISELAVIYLKEKNWSKALETYQAAEKVSDVAPDEPSKRQQLARARRGMGYALIELKRLDEAEAKYTQCLDADPNDSLSRNQIEYIRRLRGSKSTQ